MKRLSALVALLGLAACAAEPAPKSAAAAGTRLGAGDSLGQRLGRSDRALARANSDTRSAHAEAEDPGR